MVDRAQLQRLAQDVEQLRKRLEEINMRIDQVDAILAEHTITEAVLSSLLAHEHGRTISTQLPIGSGVSLPFKYNGEIEGLALVDLGSGIFGERPWREAKTITEVRHQDIQHLRDELKVQAEQTETSLAKAATTFNALAEQLKQPVPQPSAPAPVPQHPEKDEVETPSPPRIQRKRGMFSNDLTLDD